jgi:hypothetical protein
MSDDAPLPPNFKRPRPLFPEFARLVRKEDCTPGDKRPIRKAVILKMSIANAAECSDLACRRTRLCQRPAYKCRLAHHADVYDWDYTLPNCPRRAMYDEIQRRVREGQFTDDDFAKEVLEVVRSFQPDLGRKTEPPQNEEQSS